MELDKSLVLYEYPGGSAANFCRPGSVPGHGRREWKNPV
jgi:hypothetical protein